MKSAFAQSLLIGMILAAVVCGCSSGTGTDSDRPLYALMPLELGNSWTYEYRDSVAGSITLVDTIYLLVVKDTIIYGHRWFEFNQSIPFGGLPVGWVSSRSDGIYARVGSSEYLLMHYPAQVGESWNPVSVCRIEVIADTTVAVPLGLFPALTYRVGCSGLADTVETAAAVDVGVVSIRHHTRTETEEERTIDYLLIDYFVN